MGMTIWEEYKKEGKGDGRVKITLVDWIVERINKAMHWNLQYHENQCCSSSNGDDMTIFYYDYFGVINDGIIHAWMWECLYVLVCACTTCFLILG
jgi:hypothetical protein